MDDSCPKTSQLELSLFGPGYGECIVLHLGNGEWAIVDSCIDSKTKSPSALVYLKKLGVNLATQVKIIIVTHWHDDHISGIDQIYEQCTGAAFYISAAIRSTEFTELVSAYTRRSGVKCSGVNIISRTLGEAIKRQKNGGKFGFAIFQRPLLPEHHETKNYKFIALSPSDELCTKAFATFKKLNPKKDETKIRLNSPKQNETSVALWIEAGSRRLLLGADLEEGAETRGAWTTILENSKDKTGAEIFKIPHHGSENGHHDGVWENLLIQKPHAILTPYSRLKNPIPTFDDLNRLKTFTHNLSITRTLLKPTKIPNRGARNKMILASTKRFEPVPMAMGQIRLRANLDGTGDWELQHFGTALLVS